jgi:hypothetical protein
MAKISGIFSIFSKKTAFAPGISGPPELRSGTFCTAFFPLAAPEMPENQHFPAFSAYMPAKNNTDVGRSFDLNQARSVVLHVATTRIITSPTRN